MKCAVDKLLHVADHDVNQGQPDVRLFGTRYFLEVFMLLVDGIQGWKSICLHRLAGVKVPSKKSADALFANMINSLHGNKTSPFLSGFDGNKHGSFSFGASTSFTGTLAADKGVVKLNQVDKPVDTVPVCHCFSDLAKHITGSDPGNIKVFGNTKSGNAAFVGSHEVNGPKPFNQGNFGRVKQCVRSYRDLMTTLGTLIDLMRPNIVGCHAATRWTLKAIRPTYFDQCFDTCVFSAVAFLPFNQAYFVGLEKLTTC